MSNLASLLTVVADRHPERVALKLDATMLTYRQLDELTARAAAMLISRGVRPGDRVVLMVPNVPHFVIAYYGALRAGAVVVPVNVLLTAPEIAHVLEDSQATVLMAWEDFVMAAQSAAASTGTALMPVGAHRFLAELGEHELQAVIVDRHDDDTAVVLYTSGTTGRPKGAELRHRNMRSNVDAVADMFSFTERDVVLGALPLFHAFGQTACMNAALAAGATLTLLPRFDPVKALDVIERDGVTLFEGVPAMFSALLQVDESVAGSTGSVRLCASGGDAISVDVLTAFEQRFATTVYEGYGLSETAPVAAFNHPADGRVPGSIGRPIQGVQMAVADADGHPSTDPDVVGELLVRGENVMKGYWRQPEATAETIRNGWLHTGDIGRVDGDGRFYVVDRSKDLIIRGGYNVYPREVEEAVRRHPDVLEAAVVGLPHASLGQEVGAAVVRRPESTVTQAELQLFVREFVAAYKYPRRLWFVEALPKGPTGKVLKREIVAPSAVPDAPAQ